MSTDAKGETQQVMKRVVITGSSGYLGCKLVAHFRGLGAAVLGTDLRPPREVAPDEFICSDICDAALIGRLQEFAPDTVIHAAFVVTPMHDEKLMHRINIDGTRNILEAVARIQPARFMLLSSATAYGAWPDNPVPMDESWPRRARPDFQYAADKTEVEQIADEFARQHPSVAVSYVRPSIVGGPRMDNYLRRSIFGMPFLIRFDGRDVPLQFVHEDDVVGAIDAILAADGRGAFNVAPPNWTLTSEIARETNRRVVPLPFWLVKGAAWLAWNVRLAIHESPPGYLYFARYPWVLNPTRLCGELGYKFRHTSLDTIRETFRI